MLEALFDGKLEPVSTFTTGMNRDSTKSMRCNLVCPVLRIGRPIPT